METKKYPVSEIFTSPQGEGLYSGVLMTFVRLAGCSVGKVMSAEEKVKWNLNSAYELPVYTEKCTTWDGREFLCDTDFRTKEVLTPDQILARVDPGVEHVCITGGEPLIHDLVPLCDALNKEGYAIHLETSGSIKLPNLHCWVTVSPKAGVLSEVMSQANEVKLLVDEHFDEEAALKLVTGGVHDRRRLVYVQPINFEHQISSTNMQRCLALQKKHPTWRISTQAHKTWGVR